MITTRLRPIIVIIVGVLTYVVGHHSYNVPGGYHWTAARQLLACNQVVSMTGAFPDTPGCLHAQELVSLSHLLPVGGLALVVTGVVLMVRALQRRAAMTRHPAAGPPARRDWRCPDCGAVHYALPVRSCSFCGWQEVAA